MFNIKFPVTKSVTVPQPLLISSAHERLDFSLLTSKLEAFPTTPHSWIYPYIAMFQLKPDQVLVVHWVHLHLHSLK